MWRRCADYAGLMSAHIARNATCAPPGPIANGENYLLAYESCGCKNLAINIALGAERASPAAKGGSPMNRIQSLLYTRSTKGVWTPMLACVILIGTAAASLAELPQARLRLVTPERQGRRAESSPNKEWPDGPVSYIISSKERDAFEKLTTDKERDMFIWQFWERRNIVPGSITNAFKHEFYQRVAYANARFTWFRPGWKTDRGHMYIMYGPPDEVTCHPADMPYPYETWLYNRIPAIGDNVTFKFVDERNEGDYQLALRAWKKP